MDFGRIRSSDMVAGAGGLLLGIFLFLGWYKANPENRNATIDGMRGVVSGWEVHTTMRYLLLGAAVAPLILLYIVLRDHELSWPRGEMTAVVGIAAFGLVAYSGVIDRPGEPSGEITLRFGWYVALVGTLLITVGGAVRASGTERPRKPPGVL